MLPKENSRAKGILLVLSLLIATTSVEAQIKANTSGDTDTYKNKIGTIHQYPQPQTIPGKVSQPFQPDRPASFSERWVPINKGNRTIIYIDNKTVLRDVAPYAFGHGAPVIYHFWLRHPSDHENKFAMMAEADCSARTLMLNGQSATIVTPDTEQERIYGYFCASPNAQATIDELNQKRNSEVMAQRKQESELNEMARRSKIQYRASQASNLFSGLLSVPAAYGW